MPREARCVALTSRVNELGIRIHRRLGSRLLEQIWEECLCWELRHDGFEHVRQVPLAVTYEETPARQYRADIIVEQRVPLEIKAIERILPVSAFCQCMKRKL